VRKYPEYVRHQPSKLQQVAEQLYIISCKVYLGGKKQAEVGMKWSQICLPRQSDLPRGRRWRTAILARIMHSKTHRTRDRRWLDPAYTSLCGMTTVLNCRRTPVLALCCLSTIKGSHVNRASVQPIRAGKVRIRLWRSSSLMLCMSSRRSAVAMIHHVLYRASQVFPFSWPH
jgi:hypothetical protein